MSTPSPSPAIPTTSTPSDPSVGRPATESIVRLLKDPATYDERLAHVESIETHISWVFLTGRYAYKLKKPVQFEFLDFSAPHARRLACAEELHLNRRLARNVYVSLLPITLDEHRRLKLDGVGQEVDFVVKMRRLPEGRALDQLIHKEELRESEIETLAKYLVDFYASLPPEVLQPQAFHHKLIAHCQANLIGLLGRMGDAHDLQIRRIHGAQTRFLSLQEELFFNRVRDGRIVDGHGDLRAEHIYFEAVPAIIDCLEFSKDLRTIDIVDDLAFLAMDCQRLGNGRIGARVLEAYREASGDDAPNSLFDFYKSYRACVRAKVAVLRSGQGGERDRKASLRQAHQYLDWADHDASQLGRPALVIVGGLMGSGKSTLATKVAEGIGGIVIRTDETRRTLFGRSEAPAEYGENVYRREQRYRVYDEVLSQAGNLLDEGISVVLDGTFLSNELRTTAAALGKRHGACPLFVECECPRETAMMRIKERSKLDATTSEARPDLYDAQRKERDDVDPSISAIQVDATQTTNEEHQIVQSALRKVLFPE